jgi:hypothetical protein
MGSQSFKTLLPSIMTIRVAACHQMTIPLARHAERAIFPSKQDLPYGH